MSALLQVYQRVQAELHDYKVAQFVEFYNRYPTLTEEMNLLEGISDDEIRARMAQLGVADPFQKRVDPEFANQVKTNPHLLG